MQLIKNSVLVLLLIVKYISSARILGVVPTPSYSHHIVFQPIWKELASRGHELVVLTTNPIKDASISNLVEIDLSSSYEYIKNLNGTDLLNGKYGGYKTAKLLMKYKLMIAEHQLEHSDVQRIIKNQSEHFDLLMVENSIPTMFAFKHRFNCSMIGITSLGLDYIASIGIGNPFHPVTKPNHFLPYFSNLSFYERVISTIFNPLYGLFMNNVLKNGDISIAKYFGDNYPTIYELSNNFDMIFANVNPVFRVPNPTTPALVEFGSGIHIKPPTELPPELKQYLDNSKNGVIYFSLGSNVKSESIPNNLRQTILESFSELPYDFLWKFENETLPNQPSNVLIVKWVPQMDILRHPNVKAFISQCGLQSLEEALYTNVPVVAMPFFADQPYNGRMVEDIGIGKRVDKNNLTKDKFKKAINEVIGNPKYKSKISELAKLSKDQPMTGMEKVIFWTEYVIRHKGAKHLRSPFVDMPLYQYYLLDVFLFISFVVYIVFRVIKIIYCFAKCTIKRQKIKTE